jgi:diacylglycerol kinase (ATP)
MMDTYVPKPLAFIGAQGTVKIAIILNGISLKKKFFYKKVLPALKDFNVDVLETRTKDDALEFASKCVEKKYDLLIAAGGDGTLNQVLNGMLLNHEGQLDLPVLGVLPLGSGNDFARAMKISRKAKEFKERIKLFQARNLDVGKIHSTHENGDPISSYFINVADAGMGPEVVNRMSRNRSFGSGVAYYKAIIATFFSYKPITVKIKTPEWEWKNKLRTLAIGNAKFYGHGLCIAPDAKTDDGLFSTFVCGDVSVLEFIRYSGTMKNSKKIVHPKVTYASAKLIEMTAESPCRIEADGELLGFLPATIDIIPGRIKFLC